MIKRALFISSFICAMAPRAGLNLSMPVSHSHNPGGSTRSWNVSDVKCRRACPNPPQVERRFNGKEEDFETANDDFTIAIGIGARILDTRMGRWLSLDFKSMNSLWCNPYNYVGNQPIVFIDAHGYEKSKSVAYFDFVVIIVTAEQLANTFNTQPGIIQDNDTMVVYTNNISEANKLISDYETLKNQNRSFSNIQMKVHYSVENNNSKLDIEKKGTDRRIRFIDREKSSK